MTKVMGFKYYAMYRSRGESLSKMCGFCEISGLFTDLKSFESQRCFIF